MRGKAAALLGISLAVLVVASAPAYAANGNFRSMTRLTTADFYDPQHAAVGDFNGDSDPDLAVASDASNEIWIYLGGSGASFGTPTKLPAGDSPHAITVGDFNGDSDPDLAVANLNSHDVSILLGGPGASFVATTDLAVGGRPFAVAVGFFDDDPDQDLAVAVRTANPPNFGNVSIFLGQVGGTFTGPTEVPVGQGPSSLAVADLNGDMHADLAVGLRVERPGRMTIALGDGGGNFTVHSKLEVGDTPRDVATGDFNGDSDPDLVAAVTGGVTVFLGLPDAGFTGRVTFSATYDSASVASAIAVGDFNGDSDPDLAVADTDADDVSILSGAAGGTFTSPSRFAAGDGPVSVALGDFNGDSELDAATANPLSRDVAILRGGRGSSFSGPTNLFTRSGSVSLAVRDFNGDRDPDLAVGGQGVSIFTGGSGGSFALAGTFDGGYSPSIASGDFNGDRDPDLAVADQSAGVSILVGGPGASFTGPSSFPAGSGPATAVAVGDFNRDSDPDLAVGVDAYPPGSNQSLSILLGGAGASFSGPTIYASVGPTSIAVGDFNGDKDPDLAVGTYGGVEVRLGTAGGSFNGRRRYETGRGDTSVAVGDFNRDGDPDLAVANYQDRNVSILIGGEGGTFTQRNSKWLGANPSSVVVGNFNGDKDPDLAVTNALSQLRGQVSVLLGGPGPAFSGPKNFQPGYDPRSLAARDFNGDSDPDLVVANSGSNSVTVMLAIGAP